MLIKDFYNWLKADTPSSVAMKQKWGNDELSLKLGNLELDIGEEDDIFTKDQIIRNRKARLTIVKEINRQKERELEDEIRKLEKGGV